MIKKSIFTLLLLLSSALSFAQRGYYTRYYSDKALNAEARAWMESGQWRGTFTKARPHSSVNATDFYLQFQRNPEQWNALFRWLAETDLLTVAAGKHPIEGTSLVASVEDSQNGPLEKRNSESHHHHIDFQYVVKGIERFGIIDHYTSKPKDKYRPDVVHYDYDTTLTRFYDSNPEEFFIFFPSDWHIAKVNNDSQDQTIRVIVIKVDYVE